MRPQLHAVIQEAYEVFGDYRVRHSLSVCHCNCCMTEENEHTGGAFRGCCKTRNAVILSREDGEGPPAYLRRGSFALYGAQDDKPLAKEVLRALRRSG